MTAFPWFRGEILNSAQLNVSLFLAYFAIFGKKNRHDKSG
jgi:hypothetical protein